ncbi:hypothetical protein TNCT_126241 [Trichonephila clavata]|uniref:Uncharacterized protein n=1 Tax=Trichonephila clavata TaxID=2740835 RepID=A0A8X6KC82_TRICU|nr:hypothetical protein TNCT_126241 [Trichonephila clavata]
MSAALSNVWSETAAKIVSDKDGKRCRNSVSVYHQHSRFCAPFHVTQWFRLRPNSLKSFRISCWDDSLNIMSSFLFAVDQWHLDLA